MQGSDTKVTPALVTTCFVNLGGVSQIKLAEMPRLVLGMTFPKSFATGELQPVVLLYLNLQMHEISKGYLQISWCSNYMWHNTYAVNQAGQKTRSHPEGLISGFLPSCPHILFLSWLCGDFSPMK